MSNPWPPADFCDAVIDVSRWQGDIDWNALAESGLVRFVLIKATQGTDFIDPKFRANIAGAKAAGIAAAPYHFLTDDDAQAQAAHFSETVGLAHGIAFMLDWEEAAVGVETMATLGQALAATAGRDPLAYYGRYQLKAPHPVVSAWPLMLPEYPGGSGPYADTVHRAPPAPPGRDPARPFDFHQYTETGSIPGIAGHVDRSAWIGTAAQLDSWLADGALPGAGGAAPARTHDIPADDGDSADDLDDDEPADR
jgi:lysozyme